MTIVSHPSISPQLVTTWRGLKHIYIMPVSLQIDTYETRGMEAETSAPPPWSWVRPSHWQIGQTSLQHREQGRGVVSLHHLHHPVDRPPAFRLLLRVQRGPLKRKLRPTSLSLCQ